jgi:hypothetical protein
VRGLLVDVLISFVGSFFFLKGDCSSKDYSSYRNSILSKIGKATRSVGRSHISDEVFVMKMERRASVIQSKLFLNNTGG